MFTGIVQGIGTVVSVDKTRGDRTLTIAAKKFPLARLKLGASVACNGVCLTVTGRGKDRFKAQLSNETLKKTTAGSWRSGTSLNLEPALRASDELGGHLLLGHVDGRARVVGKKRDGGSLRYVFKLPAKFKKFLAPKGSIALDGVSLTVNDVKGARFGVNVIPYTQGLTALAALNAGDEANFEIDLMARYAGRLPRKKAAS